MRQAARSKLTKSGVSTRQLRFFLFFPVFSLILFSLVAGLAFAIYQGKHQNRIYTGITSLGVDLSQMTRDEAVQALTNAFPYQSGGAIALIDPATGQSWQKTPAELGLSLDTNTTVSAALMVGRTGGVMDQLRDIFSAWYYSYSHSPVFILDENKQENALNQLAAQINQPAIDARLEYKGETAVYIPAKNGRQLNIIDTRTRLAKPLISFREAKIELLIQETVPTLYDDSQSMGSVHQFITEEPIRFYIQNPLDNEDISTVNLSPDLWKSWLRTEVIERPDGSRYHNTYLDENAARQWLSQQAEQLYSAPVNARYYFDDDLQKLVLVSPHVNGRELDIEATLAQLLEPAQTTDHHIPFIFSETVPTAHSNATAEELGITELISERTTWFYGSSDARKRNISRAAANFYGIVIAPGEEFSFNKYLGTISEDDGYEEGLIIYGGQTIKGIGGGVCQVSTTIFQTAFYAGFPITERWQHGYMLGYYNDGEGPGMDATVFTPIVDFKFINNTPYHLLIENYYDEREESFTFKFYSTSLGRRVEKAGPVFENIRHYTD